ncbi:hypothetical protein ACVINW_006029 [Bradyrhizobium sp. USDA 4461]
MIVAAAKGAHDVAEQAQRAPVEPDLRQRGTHQGADEDQVAAAFVAEQPGRPPELADRDPAVAKLLQARRIAGAAQREQHRRDAACGELIGNRERHGAAAGNHADRRGKRGSRGRHAGGHPLLICYRREDRAAGACHPR